MLIGVLSWVSPVNRPSRAERVLRVRALDSPSRLRASPSTALLQDSSPAPVSPEHSRSIACCQVDMSLFSSAHASLMLTLVMPARLVTLPVTLSSASFTRLRSVVNSTLPTPVGSRARPIRSPGASRSNSDCAVRSTARDEPTRKLASSTTNNSRRPVVAVSLAE